MSPLALWRLTFSPSPSGLLPLLLVLGLSLSSAPGLSWSLLAGLLGLLPLARLSLLPASGLVLSLLARLVLSLLSGPLVLPSRLLSLPGLLLSGLLLSGLVLPSESGLLWLLVPGLLVLLSVPGLLGSLPSVAGLVTLDVPLLGLAPLGRLTGVGARSSRLPRSRLSTRLGLPPRRRPTIGRSATRLPRRRSLGLPHLGRSGPRPSLEPIGGRSLRFGPGRRSDARVIAHPLFVRSVGRPRHCPFALFVRPFALFDRSFFSIVVSPAVPCFLSPLFPTFVRPAALVSRPLGLVGRCVALLVLFPGFRLLALAGRQELAGLRIARLSLGRLAVFLPILACVSSLVRPLVAVPSLVLCVVGTHG